MSVFGDDSTTSGDQKEKTTENKADQLSFLDRLLQEKGDHWKEPEIIAKGYLHAQQRIKELEEYEEKAKEQDYAKQLLSRLQEQAPAPTSGKTEENKRQGSAEAENTTLAPEDLESLIERTLTKRETENSIKENLREAERQLVEKFGTEASSRVEARAKELRMSKDELKELAGKSPTAFLTLLGEAPARDTNSSPKASVNTVGFENSGAKRDHSWYQKLRRENRNLYYSPEIQMQMFNDRVKLGDNFYN